MQLFMGNLPFSATNESLSELFDRFGEIVFITVHHDRDTGRSRGFGFIELAPEEAGLSAMAALDGAIVDGRRVAVSPRRRRPETDAAEPIDLTTVRSGSVDEATLVDALTPLLLGRPIDSLFLSEPDPRPMLVGYNQRFVSDDLIRRLARTPELMFGLTPRAFEELCAGLMDRTGFEHIVLTGRGPDGGVDIWATRPDPAGRSLYAVQCKRLTRGKVPRSTLQQMYGILHDRRASRAIVTTTTGFSRPAREWHKGNAFQVGLLDFDGMHKWLRDCVAP
jgi:hypothetical protein